MDGGSEDLTGGGQLTPANCTLRNPGRRKEEQFGLKMAGSRTNHPLCHLRTQLVLPGRTPGSWGINDAGDPNRLSLLADTAGPLGVSDCGEPGRLIIPGLNTLHEWGNEQR